MGSPISSTVAEILLQYIENTHIKHLIESRNIIYYARYVDDIFVIYDITKASIDEIQQYADRIHKNLKLTITQENNNQISFLDLLITRQNHKLDIDIYRKSTTTDTTINYTSNHPIEHKLAAYRSYINRMNNLPLSKENQKKEWKTILAIAHNNSFPANKIIKLRKQIEHSRNHQETITNSERKKERKKDKWTTFTCYSPQKRKIKPLQKYRHTCNTQKQ
jgi:uncharacterized protein (UPF0335 family)